MAEDTLQPTPNLARAAGTVMLAFLFSQLTGLIAKILIGAAFPAGFDLDAFYVANQPSESLLTIIAGGILVSSFIPIFVKFLVKGENQSAWRLVSATANWILIITSSLAALEVIFARPIVQYLLGSGFSFEKQILTVQLLRIQALSVVLFGLSGILVGILNSHKKFLASALSPAMYNLGQIFGVLFLAPSMGIHGLAWGVVIGSLFSLVVQLPSLLRLKGSYSLSLGTQNSSVGEVFRLMAPRMFGAAAVQLMVWVNTLLASNMPDGSVYSLRLGFSLMMIAWAIVAQSIATAVMPTFSAQFASGRLDHLRSTLASMLRSVLLLAIPATVGLILLRLPIITLVFQRREFTTLTTQMVAWALLWYTVGLVFHSVLEILVRAYYAMHDTKTPVLVGVAAMIVSIGLSLAFSRIFSAVGWMPLGGLAMAVSVSTAMEAVILYIIMHKHLGGIPHQGILLGLVAACTGSLGMMLVLLIWQRLTTQLSAGVMALGGVVLGIVVYSLVLSTFRLPELTRILQVIKKQLSKLTRPS